MEHKEEKIGGELIYQGSIIRWKSTPSEWRTAPPLCGKWCIIPAG